MNENNGDMKFKFTSAPLESIRKGDVVRRVSGAGMVYGRTGTVITIGDKKSTIKWDGSPDDPEIIENDSIKKIE